MQLDQLVEKLHVLKEAGTEKVSLLDLNKILNDIEESSSHLPADATDKLSDTEMVIFLRLASGKSIRQIAEELGRSSNTISTHRTRIIHKTGLKNNKEIIAHGIRHNLV